MKDSSSNLSSRNPVQAQPSVELGGVPFGPALTIWLYLMLGASAALSLWSQHFRGALPSRLELAAPILFFAFLVGFSLYRLRLVQVKKYPAFKAFFQIGAGLIFLTLLFPAAKGQYEAREGGLEALLSDADPGVRALAAEVVRYRPEGSKYGVLLVKALRDPDLHVREEAHRSLVQLSGRDLGEPSDEQAIQAWGEKFR